MMFTREKQTKGNRRKKVLFQLFLLLIRTMTPLDVTGEKELHLHVDTVLY